MDARTAQRMNWNGIYAVRSLPEAVIRSSYTLGRPGANAPDRARCIERALRRP